MLSANQIAGFFKMLISWDRSEWWSLFLASRYTSEVSYKIIISLWMCITRHAQSTQNKFAISLQYLKENLKDEVDFFACRYTSKVSSNWYYYFRFMWPSMSKLPKIKSLLFLCNILSKKWVISWFFACR